MQKSSVIINPHILIIRPQDQSSNTYILSISGLAPGPTYNPTVSLAKGPVPGGMQRSHIPDECLEAIKTLLASM